MMITGISNKQYSNLKPIEIFSEQNGYIKVLNYPGSGSVTEIIYTDTLPADEPFYKEVKMSTQIINSITYTYYDILEPMENISNIGEINDYFNNVFNLSNFSIVDDQTVRKRLEIIRIHLIPKLDSNNEIPHLAFNHVPLYNLTLPDNTQKINDSVFSSFHSVINNLTIPSSVTHIGNNAFNEVRIINNINLFTIPSNLINIGMNAFQNSQNNRRSILNNLIIPSSVENIGSSAFSGVRINTEKLFEDGRVKPINIENFAFFYSSAMRQSILRNSSLILNLNIPSSATFQDQSFQGFRYCEFPRSLFNRLNDHLLLASNQICSSTRETSSSTRETSSSTVQTTKSTEETNNKNNSYLWIIYIVIFFAIIGGGIYFFI